MSLSKYVDYKIILDSPSSDPVLGFDQYANAFCQIIEKSDPRFAIGIFGTWGSGKTTLMEKIKFKLEETSSKCIPIWFNAWRYEKEEHLIIPLLDTLQDELVNWVKLNPLERKKAEELGKIIGKVMKSLIAGFNIKLAIPGVFDLSFDANKVLAKYLKTDRRKNIGDARSFYFLCFNALKKAFKDFVDPKGRDRIVVFIDDLDRCLPDSALEIIESMKLFFDMEGFIFIVGLDKERIAWMITQKYSQYAQTEKVHIKGEDYVKKIFQVPFSLEPVSVDQIDDYLKAICEEADLPEKQKDDIDKTVQPHLKFIVYEPRTDGVVNLTPQVNPREIKRYINRYTLRMKTKGHLKINPNVVLTIQTINVRQEWEVVREALYGFRLEFIQAIQAKLQRKDEPLDKLMQDLGEVPDTFLKYVMEGEPGHVLINPDLKLKDYLFSGEIIEVESEEMLSYSDPELFRYLSESLLLVREIREEDIENREELFEKLIENSRFLSKYLSNYSDKEIIWRDSRILEEKFYELPDIYEITRSSEGIQWLDIVHSTLKRLFDTLRLGSGQKY